MIHKSNLHTHTQYCDGKNTPREVVQEALRMGLDSIGFSGHSPQVFTPEACVTDDGEMFWMSQEQKERYICEIHDLKQEFAGQLDIFCGIELDLYSDVDSAAFDYVIGSIHYVKKDQLYLSVDESEAVFKRCVREYFAGDYIAFAEAYFAQYQQLAKLSPDIVGHFDLVTKYNEGSRLFDESDARYQAAGFAALERLRGCGAMLEINTGAMSRGTRRSPYPSPMFLREWKRLGGEVVIASDSHDVATLTYGFDMAAGVAAGCGYQYVKELTTDGFVKKKL